MDKVVVIILIVLYALQASFSVDAQKQINELRKELYLLKKRNDVCFDFFTEKTDSKSNNPPKDGKQSFK